MTTDFRALCAELLDEMDYYTDWSDAKEVKDRARAALAEPQPEPPTDEEVAELVAWLREGGEDAAANGWDHQARQFARAAELLQLQQPVPVSEPPDQRHPECVKAWPDCWDGGYDPRCCRFPKSCSCEVRYALPLPPESTQAIEPQERTLLVPAAQPIPVSERLPGPGDCDTEGRCWTWAIGTWRLSRINRSFHTHWLSAHALPLPS